MLKFMEHQKEAFEFIVAHNGQAGLFMAPGTGKTLVAERYAEPYLPALLILRRDDFLTWETHLLEELYDPDDFHMIKKGKHKMIQARWTMVTYDLLKNEKIFKWVKSQSWGIVIADESHMAKNYKTQRTKRVIKATRHIPKRLALSGSPITNELIDIMSQAWFIDDGRTFGKSRWWFLKQYYAKTGYGWEPRKGSKDAIAEKLKRIAFHVHEDDCLKLPPIRMITKGVEMSKMQRKYYDQVANDWETSIRGVEIEMSHVIAQMNLFRQISSGFIYNEQKEAVWFCSNKLKLLKALIKDPEYLGLKDKIVIWCAYIAEIDKIAELLEGMEMKVVKFYGGLKEDEKVAARKQFKNDPATQVFIGQCDSGVGMNELIVSDVAVYYSNSFKVVSRQQNMRRIRRKGSESHQSITYIDLATEKSLDTHIIESLKKNMDVATYIMDKIKRGQPIPGIFQKSF
jgi:superfamily II DNA or RNA helicase